MAMACLEEWKIGKVANVSKPVPSICISTHYKDVHQRKHEKKSTIFWFHLRSKCDRAVAKAHIDIRIASCIAGSVF